MSSHLKYPSVQSRASCFPPTLGRLAPITCTLFVLLFPSFGTMAAPQMLEEVFTSSEGASPEIVLRFGVPVRYVSHSPAGPADTLRIRLMIADGNAPALGMAPQRETVSWKATAGIPLTEVAYEPSGSGAAQVILHFRKDRSFTVTPGDDGRSITVALDDDEAIGHARGADPSVADPRQSGANGATSAAERDKADKPAANGGAPATPLDKARQAVVQEDWVSVLGLYSKLLQQPDMAAYYPEAHEMVGLARERLGQGWRAKQAYENYLKLYPKGEGAERVRQRLVGLESVTRKEKQKLGEAKTGAAGKTAGASLWETYGGFSQYYFQAGRFSDSKGVTRDTSLLLSNLSVNSRYRDDRFDVRGRFDARYREDFIDDEKRLFRVSSAYVDAQDRQFGWMTRLGRQTRSTGGVLGRFDGGVVGYRITPKFQAVAVGGFPVQPFRSTEPNFDQSFYGFSLEAGPFYDVWAGNVYFINQDVRGLSIPDRRAIGGELRYLDPVHPVFSQIDYDIHLNELNIAQLQGSWNFENGAILQANFDYRRTPISSTASGLDLLRNNTLGAINDALFQQLITDAIIREAAKLDSSIMKTFTLGGIMPISRRFQFNGEISVSDLSGGSNLSRFVQDALGPQYASYFLGLQSTGLQVSYSAQLIGNGLLADRDIWTLGVRYTDNNKMQNVVSAYLDSQYPLTPDLRIAPRVRVDYYDSGRSFSNSDMLRVRPAMRMTYNVYKALSVELEGGIEWSNNKDREGSDQTDYYFSAGYRVDF